MAAVEAESKAAPTGFKATIGNDLEANAEAAQALCGFDFPMVLRFTNEMPRRVTFPELQGLYLAHVAGLPALKSGTATIRNADQLHRFVTDVHALCELNGFKHGVTLEVI